MRARHVVRTGLCIVLSGLGGVLPVGPASAVVPPSIPAAAPPLPAVESSGTLGVLSEPAYIRGHDKGQSTLYDNGAGLRFSYWSFGDTAVERDARPFLGNTGARTYDATMSDNIGSWVYDNLDAEGIPNEAFPVPPGYGSDYRVWGGSVVADSANHRMIGIYHIIQGTPGTSRGYGVAIWSESTGAWAPVAVANPTDPARPYVLWPENTRIFNTGMILRGGYLYAYGCYTSFRCSLARVSATGTVAVSDRAAWTFYTGIGGAGCTADSWSSDVNCAQPLQSAERDLLGQPVAMLGGAAGTSVFWNAYLGVYMAVYSAPGADQIQYSVADRLEGPWSAPGIIGRGTPSPLGQTLYAGYAHPEFAEQNGKVQYITYARNLGSFDSEFGLMRVVFGAAPATYQRHTTGECYYGDSGGTLRISGAGPMSVDTTGTQPSGTDTAAWDRQCSIYAPGAASPGSSAIVRVDAHSSANPSSLGGLVMRNSVAWAHNGLFTTAGQGYVALVSAPGGGGVSLRWDSDGDQDLDSRLPATPNSVVAPVWLRLARTSATSYEGLYSTTSTNGTDGAWTSLGSATVPTAQSRQDVALLSAGASEASANRTVFSSFEVLPGWISSWTTSVSLDTGGPGTTYQNGFQNQTVRNIVHTSIGGDSARVRISNAFGSAALPVASASIGLPAAPGGPDLAPASVRPLTFAGQTSVSIPVGGEIYSDPVPLAVGADQDLAVSLYFNAATGTPTWHRYALRDTYVYPGDHTGDPAGGGYLTPSPQAWYYVSAVDVLNDHALGSVIALGDSTTDGVGTSSGNRWTDKLTDRFVAAGDVRVGVSNQGVAGAQAETASTRLPRDLLTQSGGRTAVIILGINDLIDGSPIPAADIIGHIRTIAAQAKANGMRVLVSTITPLGVHTTAVNEPIRQEVNTYLIASNEFDGIIDLDTALKDPTTPTKIKDIWAAAPGSVHPNTAGHQIIANTLFELGELVRPPRTR